MRLPFYFILALLFDLYIFYYTILSTITSDKPAGVKLKQTKSIFSKKFIIILNILIKKIYFIVPRGALFVKGMICHL